jgi:hypothetical protein
VAEQERVDWSRQEVEATISDYFSMLSAELSVMPYSKAKHRRALLQKLNNRSPQSVEFKHANISAILIELGFPYVAGINLAQIINGCSMRSYRSALPLTHRYSLWQPQMQNGQW